jgi:IS5 family transposase
VRATARQISFADWELMRQGDRGVRLEPLLEAISAFLDETSSSVSGAIWCGA